MSAHEPSWRTQQVKDICMAIRTSKDPKGLRMLAQALEDAGFMDSSVLDVLRKHHWGVGTEAERAVARVYSQETSDAVFWLMNHADQANMGYKHMMDAAAEWLRTSADVEDGGEYCYMGTNEDYKDVDWGPDFWKRYELVTGVKAGEKLQHNFFSCSC